MELTNKEDILKRLGCPNAEVTAEELESLSKSDLVGIVLKETQNGFRWLPKEIDTEVYDLKGQIEKALVDAYRVIELEKLQKEEEKQIANETKYDGLSAAEYFEVLSKDEFGGAIEIMKISPDMEVIEREQEIKELTYVSNRENPTALILGPAGLGKTALVSGWKLRQDQVDKLHVQIISLHMNLLENEGDMAQRLIRLIPALKRYEDKLKEEDEKARVVLFIDEVHTVITSFDNKGVKTKLGADVLKTITTKAPIMLIGATTENEYNQYIAPDEAFVRRFRLIRLTSISKLATRAALRNKLIKRLGYDFSHNVGDNVLNYIIDFRLLQVFFVNFSFKFSPSAARSRTTNFVPVQPILFLKPRSLLVAVPSAVFLRFIIEKEKRRSFRFLLRSPSFSYLGPFIYFISHFPFRSDRISRSIPRSRNHLFAAFYISL